MIIADDMPMQLHMLEEMTRRLRPGWEILPAKNGNEILAYMEERAVDIILSDIRMPKMDGLAMLEEVQAISPGTLVVFLSGYALFEYAQRAIQLGAFDYLIKPVEEKALSGLLYRLEAALDQRTDDQAVVTSAILYQWLFSPPEQWTPSEQKRIESETYPDGWVLMFYRATSVVRYSAALQARIRQAFAASFSIKLFVPFSERQVLVAVVHDQGRGDSDAVERLLPALCRQEGLLAGMSEWFAGPQEGPRARLQAAQALNQSFYRSQGPLRALQSAPSLPSRMPAGDMLLHWIQLDAKEQEERIGEVLDTVAQKEPWFIEMLQSAVYGCAELVQLAEKQVDADALSRELQKLSAALRQLKTFADFRREYLQAAQRFARILETQMHQKDLPIEKCLQYLHKNYSQALSMEETARMFFLTPNYFSTLFRKKTGKRFVEYLTDLRMDKAEARIRLTDDFMYEIAKECGYEDERYFNRVFRAKYGCSPAHFRKLHGRAKV